MELIVELVKIVLPAAVVLYAMYLTVKAFINKETEQKWLDIRMKNKESVLPIRLQAYERICLFMERAHPNNLVLRMNAPAYNAKEFQHILIKEIRDEFNHNLSQQVYMSNEAWNLTRGAMEDVLALISEAAMGMTENNKGAELARKILEQMGQRKDDPIMLALTFVKDEVRQLY